jgi:hypothetical protein
MINFLATGSLGIPCALKDLVIYRETEDQGDYFCDLQSVSCAFANDFSKTKHQTVGLFLGKQVKVISIAALFDLSLEYPDNFRLKRSMMEAAIQGMKTQIDENGVFHDLISGKDIQLVMINGEWAFAEEDLCGLLGMTAEELRKAYDAGIERKGR